MILRARNEARTAIRQFHDKFKKSLLQTGNRTTCFKYVNKRLGKFAESSIVIMNGTELDSDRDAADLLNVEFRSNFNSIAKSSTSAMVSISLKTGG